jgi:exodeoxyribonuclease X
MSLRSLILDTETHALNGYPIEIAYAPIDINDQGLTLDHSQIFDHYYSLDQHTEIHLASMAVHHILPQDLIGKPPYQSFRLPSETCYLIGHNVDYDVQALARCGQATQHLKAICTLALARALWPKLDSYNLSSLSYYISADLAQTRSQLKNAHNAKTDILLTAQLLEKIIAELNINSIEALYQHSQQARLPQYMPFGKHKGQALSDVPLDYVQWLLRQDQLDPYLKQALQRRLG